MPFILQLSEWTGAETAFIIPTEHNESDSLHIQVVLGLAFSFIYCFLLGFISTF